MRLWHSDLLPVLPRKHLLSQLRECAAIASRIKSNGTPNHVLVNRVLDFPIDHFRSYCKMVVEEMGRRGYLVTDATKRRLENWLDCDKLEKMVEKPFTSIDPDKKDWFNYRYLRQCLANLQEKYDCGMISEEEWKKIVEFCEKKLIDPETLYCYD